MTLSSQPYLLHLQTSDNLVTTYEARRTGFISLALERNGRSTPIVEEARTLKAMASQATNPKELLDFPDLQHALLTAAGISDKAAKHLLPEDRVEAIQGLIDNFLEPAGTAFIEELVYRFLLTRGDSLGGTLRNVAGILAQRKFTRATIAAITLSGKSYTWQDSRTKRWIPMTNDDAGIESSLRGLSWATSEAQRTIIFNLKVPLIGNNVDICVFNCSPDQLGPKIYGNATRYIALGELKGGIDPAGADEHWKTARTALGRVRDGFANHNTNPPTFFVGAAIEKNMSKEIWSQLGNGSLTNAANLIQPDQVASLCAWLVSL